MENLSKDYGYWEARFKAQDMAAFNHNSSALIWLKVKAISRKELIEKFITENNINLASSKVREQGAELFGILDEKPWQEAMAMLDKFLTDRNNEWYEAKGVDEVSLKSDLYKVQNYEWGGDQNNSLDKFLVSHYVKTISDYGLLLSRQGDIANNAWNYVQTSWYNNWTSYLIESIFKRHKRVVSAVGEIKGVDFFIGDIPLDLKVTFFPQQFMEERLKVKLGKRQLTWLRQEAKKAGITVDRELPDAQQMYMLCERLYQSGQMGSLDRLKAVRKEIVDEAINDKTALMQWLYEKQGEMRFGAENRIFVILADSDDMTQSWKLKRNFDLIEPRIKNYLDDFDEKSLATVKFQYHGNKYNSMADIIFVVKQ